MTDPNNPCIFCDLKKQVIIYENDYAFVSYDSYPVSKFHSLIIPKRHIKNFFDLNDKELNACNELIKKGYKEAIMHISDWIKPAKKGLDEKIFTEIKDI